MLNAPQFREKEKRRHVFLSTIPHASHTQGQAEWPEVINVTAFKDCCIVTTLTVRVLKLLSAQRVS